MELLETVLAPLLAADGGELYLVSASESLVSLHLGGRYSGCPGNNLVRRRILEPAIATVAPGARVDVSSGAIVPPGARKLGLHAHHPANTP
ncbi:MAG: NifU family protein [Polyangiaceae bacterium]|nr:NifU family protein [Polyangiaceae bacterium]